MQTNATHLQPGGSLIARILVSILCLTSMCVVGVSLVFMWKLVYDNFDWPPTWYWALTIFVCLVDVFAMCYLGFKALRVLMAETTASRALRSTAVVLLSLFVVHVATVYTYSKIPQWDFQGDLFNDLSKPPVGIISADCREDNSETAPNGATVSPSNTPGVGNHITYDEVLKISRISDWSKRQDELGTRTISGWRGWIQDLSSHASYDDPERRILSVFLHNPYAELTEMTGASHGIYGSPEAELYRFSAADTGALSVCQEILVCGALSDVNFYSSPGLKIGIIWPVINPLPLSPAIQAIQIPDDFLVEYISHGCDDGYVCPEYKVTVDARGTIAYYSYNGAQSKLGAEHAQVGQDKVRQLVFELERTHFLSLSSLPDKIEGDKAGATVISARLNGTTKVGVLPWRGTAVPDPVQMLVGKIQEVSGLQQWVTLVK